MLFPTQKIANYCRAFIQERLSQSGTDGSARLVQLLICPDDLKRDGKSGPADISVDLHIVLFPKDAFGIAKEFWQHTGLGISSRLAEKCHSLLSDGSSLSPSPTNLPKNSYGIKGHNRHYSVKSANPTPAQPTILPSSAKEELNADHTSYFEERYGRNLPASAASAAKSVLRSRIAQGLVANQDRGRTLSVTADDVYLYPCGMAAIWNAHRLLLDLRPPAKSVCFGLVPIAPHMTFG
jgi:cystathionine gamma-synthase